MVRKRSRRGSEDAVRGPCLLIFSPSRPNLSRNLFWLGRGRAKSRNPLPKLRKQIQKARLGREIRNPVGNLGWKGANSGLRRQFGVKLGEGLRWLKRRPREARVVSPILIGARARLTQAVRGCRGQSGRTVGAWLPQDAQRPCLGLAAARLARSILNSAISTVD